MLFSLYLNFFRGDFAAKLTASPTGDRRRESACRAASHDDGNMFWFRELGEQCVIRCWRPLFLWRFEHAHSGALTAIHPRAQLSQGATNLFIKKLAHIVF